MQKNNDKDSFKIGEYTIKRKHIRRQGQTVKKSKKTPVKLVKSLLGFVLVVFLVGVAFMFGVALRSYTTFNTQFFTKSHGIEQSTNSPYKAMAVIETSSKRLLAGYHENEKLPMASTTKIMTAILTIEKMPDLTKEFEVPSVAVGVEGSSMYLKKGEVLSLEEYLYGLMLPSGNDAAVALANIISGSEEAFAKEMNIFAQQLGLSNTSFVTASGLHDSNHYTTALDLATLTAYAMQNNKFREIVGVKTKTIRGPEENKPRHLKNKQKLMTDENLILNNINVTGVKSGFTPEAGRCLVTSAEHNGMEVIAVVLNAPQMFESTAKALLEVFEDYKMVNLLNPKQHITKVPVTGSNVKDVNLYSLEGYSYPLTDEEKAMVKIKFNYPNKLSAPLSKDQMVGEVQIELYGQTIFNTSINTIQEAKANSINSIINKLVEAF